jgi:hypothetical protein
LGALHGRMASYPGSAPLPSSSPPPRDPLDTTPGLVLKADLDPRLGPGFVGYDDAGRVLLRGHRDGEGLRAILMNFVLENAAGQPYFHIREPTSGFHFDVPFRLLAPDGSAVGDLHFGMNRASLQVPGRMPLTAALPVLPWHGYAVEQGSVTLATITFVGHSLSIPGADLHLHFEPLGSAAPIRRWVVALVAWATLFAPPWREIRTR